MFLSTVINKLAVVRYGYNSMTASCEALRTRTASLESDKKPVNAFPKR